MTDAPSPPNRRRRRIVVLTVAVLVLGLCWWFWPRVDQRFVGTWVLKDSYEHEFEVVELLSNGTGLAFETRSELELRKPLWHIKWRADGESFAIKYRRNGIYANIDFVIWELWRAIDDRRCVLYDDCFRVLNLERDSFTALNNNTVLPWVRLADRK